MALITGLKIDGVDMPSPLPYEVEINSLDGEAGRNNNGKMIRDFVDDKISVALQWGMLTQAETNQILSAVNPKKGHVFFQATIYTAEDGEYTGTFYAGSRKQPIALQTSSGTLYRGVSFNIIER
ncbi:hypothetical protein J3A84_04895 [Proteiniclasticum sp. SCR006]|uniref:Uncharacterized protein n=1 Tax=Proteiniclasticum aestuarii TaxID=2817862 RepID=A0A939H9D6_9CLOT|nr:DUF6711 family protein [Proteiniclasticum aestuarii]MBO1264378.1 hypothetical protein [Proteiniclasticum aestuarii]